MTNQTSRAQTARIMYGLRDQRGRQKVYLDRSPVGEIRRTKDGGYYYKPTGGKAGDVFKSLPELRRSLESAS